METHTEVTHSNLYNLVILHKQIRHWDYFSYIPDALISKQDIPYLNRCVDTAIQDMYPVLLQFKFS